MEIYFIDVVFEIPIVDVICVDCGPLTDFLMHLYMDYGVKGGIYIHEKKLSSCIFIALPCHAYFHATQISWNFLHFAIPNFGLIVLYDPDC